MSKANSMRATASPDRKDKLGAGSVQAVPATCGIDPDKARRAVAGILELSKGVTLGGLRIKELIDEGRP
jgi:hypothetical protein